MEQINAYFEAFAELFTNQPYLQAGLIIFISYIAARFISKQVSGFLAKLADRFSLDLARQISEMLATPLFYLMFLSAFGFAVNRFPIGETTQGYVVSALKSVMIVIWAAFIYRVIKLLLEKAAVQKEKFQAIQPATLPLFENIGAILIAVVTVHQIFSAWSVDMTALLASAGIAGLAIGMASKDLLSDIISGVLILTDHPYQIGDFVEVDSGSKGIVTHIGLRNTRLLTTSHIEIIIPNSLMGNRKVVNNSGGPAEKMRFGIDIGVAYGTDIKLAKRTLVEVANLCPALLEDPPPKARITRLGESRIDIELLGWIDVPKKRKLAIDQLFESIYERFTQDGITFAHDKRDIYIKQAPDSKQEISIKELPIGRQMVHIKEMPSLFANK